jgi:phosphotransferase system  glucose/maltose/N-acetylglucosamine-specific IIC component
MDGYKLKTWNFWMALLVAVIVAFVFYWIIINKDGKLQDAAKDMNTIMMFILIGLSLIVSGSTWLYFFLRKKRLGVAAAEGQKTSLPRKDLKSN